MKKNIRGKALGYTSADIDSMKVKGDTNIRTAIKKMDACGLGIIVITNQFDTVIGIITDGDFRRAVLNNCSLDLPVSSIANKKFVFVTNGYSKDEVKKLFSDTRIKWVPVLKNGRLSDILCAERIASFANTGKMHKKIPIPAVIMAGGEGARMKPFTKILPKALIPAGEKTMIELIFDEYQKFGVENFYITLNYKAGIIRAYLDEIEHKGHFEFIHEKKFLGTAGSLKYLQGKVHTPFFVSNCDTIIKTDYYDLYDFHKSQKNDFTLVTSVQHHIVPYGVCALGKNGSFKGINEKPRFDFLVNTGMYVLEPCVLECIPEDIQFDMIALIDAIRRKRLKIGVFPVSEQSWIDMGQFHDYQNFLDKLLL